MSAPAHRYLIALGSNMRHPRHGDPRAVLRAVPGVLARAGLVVVGVAPLIDSAPLGPSARRYANGAVLVESALRPVALLALLQGVERGFGRRARGRRWGARVLDLDIVLWSAGCWASPGLVVPHRLFRERLFVLRPANALVPQARDPLSGRTIRQLTTGLTRRLSAPKRAGRLVRAHSSVGRATDF